MLSTPDDTNVTAEEKPLSGAVQKVPLASILAPIVVAVVIIAAVVVYANVQRDQLLSHGDYTVDQIADSVTDEITATVAYGKSSILNVSTYLSNSMTSDVLENPAEVINPLTEHTPFTGIEYIRQDGMNVMNIGEPFDASDRVYYQEGIKGNTGTWNNYHPKIAKETLINFYTPLKRNGKTVGVVTGYIGATTDISDMLEETFYENPVHGILYDSEGMVIATSLQADFEADMTLNTLLTKVGTDSAVITEFEKIMAQDTDGAVKYNDASGEGRICVKSVEDTDWKVAVVVTPESFNAAYGNLMRTSAAAIIVIFITLGLYLAFMLVRNSRERKRIRVENDRLERENRAFNEENKRAFDKLKSTNAQLEEAAAKQDEHIREITKLNAQVVEQSATVANAGLGIWSIVLEDGQPPRMKPNDKMRELLGIEGKDLSEQEMYDSWYGRILPEEIDSVESSVAEMLQGGFSENTYQWEHPTKGVRYVRCGGTATKPREGGAIISGYHADVTELVLSEQQSKRELQEAKSLAEKHNKDLASQLDIIQSVSKAFNSLYYIDMRDGSFVELGVNTDGVHEVIGKKGDARSSFENMLKYLVAPDQVDRMREFTELSTINDRLKDEQWVSCQFLNPNRGWSEGIFIAANRSEEGICDHVVWATRDIDKDKRREIAYQEELERATIEAESANAAKSTFLFNMSHDIRTPMNAIIGFTDLLEKSQGDPHKVNDYLAKIRKSSQFLLTLINNVLEMARIETGNSVLDESPCNLDRFLQAIRVVFEEQMRQKDVTFTVRANVEHPNILGDEVKLREIYLNLISNACKYTMPGGSVLLEITELPSEREGWGVYQTVVSDTGIGMSEEFLPHLFDEFTREKTSTGNKIQGTGLGMAIVRQYVDLMDGKIEVESKLGEGTTFILRIAHKITDRENIKEVIDPETAIGYFGGKRILLAEDNDLNAEIAIEILGEFGFIVDRAEDGVICVDRLMNSKDDFYDAILMDIQMPNLNGYDATKTIRALKDEKKARIPIFAMTANAFEEDKRDALNAGMNGHLAKPIEIPKLIEMLSTVISGSPERQVTKVEPDPGLMIEAWRSFAEKGHSNILSVMPDGFFSYEAHGEEKLLYANDLACEIWGCANMDELMEYTGGSFRGLIHPEDYEQTEHNIWSQIADGIDDLDHVTYRIVRKDGEIRWIDDYGHLAKGENGIEVFYVLVADITDER